MTCKAVVFDLDGTLLDTIEDLAGAMNAALGRMGYPTHDAAACRYFVGDGLRAFAVRALPEEARGDEATVARCCELFRAAYAEGWRERTRPYEGVEEMLDGLAGRGVPMAVLSNKPDDFTRRMVGELLGRWDFAAVRGVREDGVRKPDPAGALEMAARLGAAAEEVLYVGDTNTDMRTAVAAGMFPVGATWGFRPAAELTAAGARRLIDHPAELLGLL